MLLIWVSGFTERLESRLEDRNFTNLVDIITKNFKRTQVGTLTTHYPALAQNAPEIATGVAGVDNCSIGLFSSRTIIVCLLTLGLHLLVPIYLSHHAGSRQGGWVTRWLFTVDGYVSRVGDYVRHCCLAILSYRLAFSCSRAPRKLARQFPRAGTECLTSCKSTKPQETLWIELAQYLPELQILV